ARGGGPRRAVPARGDGTGRSGARPEVRGRRLRAAGGAPAHPVKVAFDSRPAKEVHGIGRYARSLLHALRETGRGEIVETHEPRRCDVFHAPWIDGAMLRSPVPMVVTLHDLIPLKR